MVILGRLDNLPGVGLYAIRSCKKGGLGKWDSSRLFVWGLMGRKLRLPTDVVCIIGLSAIGLRHVMHKLQLLCSNCSFHNIGQCFNSDVINPLRGPWGVESEVRTFTQSEVLSGQTTKKIYKQSKTTNSTPTEPSENRTDQDISNGVATCVPMNSRSCTEAKEHHQTT